MAKKPDSPEWLLSKPSEVMKRMRERVVWQSHKHDPTVSIVHLFAITRTGKLKETGWMELRFNLVHYDGSAPAFDYTGWLCLQEHLGQATWQLYCAQDDLNAGRPISYL